MSNQKYSFITVMLRVIPIQLKAVPVRSVIDMLLGVSHALMFAATVVATQILFDAIALASAGQIGFMDCAIPLLLLASATFGQQIMNGAHYFVGTMNFDKALGKVKALLQRKLQRVDPICFENTAFLDDLNKAREGAPAALHFSNIAIGLVCFYGVYFASIGAYLISLKPILVIILMLAFFPALLAQFVRGKIFTMLEEESAPLRRKYEYYQKALCDREYFKETRILGAFTFFHNLFSETMSLLSRRQWQIERKASLIQLLLNISSFTGMAIAAYLMFTATMAGEITVGAFAAVFQALSMMFYLMQEIVNMQIGYMNKDLGKVTNFIRMLDMPEHTGVEGTTDFSEGITADNITFTYPGRDKPAVRDVSLNIANGETIAIVGENGAGKSTLVRLLAGIYRPSEGKIIVGGLDTAKTAPASIFNGISGVFQKYQRYKMTLRENVTISDPDAAINTETMEVALKEADFDLENVNLETMLSPEFDGIDLSGGQWQRLAIARGLYRTNGFIVLDEPTAAIDPIEETRIYTQFQRLAEGKCAVVVTHRLGSAKLAHRIIVMDNGQIVDTGTHEELLSRPGKYTDMWAAQAKWYERAEA